MMCQQLRSQLVDGLTSIRQPLHSFRIEISASQTSMGSHSPRQGLHLLKRQNIMSRTTRGVPPGKGSMSARAQ